MASSNELDTIVSNGHCMSCGFCTVPTQLGGKAAAGQLNFDEKEGIFTPQVKNTTDSIDFVCPGATMNMPALALQKHGYLPDNPMLGTFREAKVLYSNNQNIREKSASGGVVFAILEHLFKEGLIDVAYVADRGESAYGGGGRVIKSVAEFGQAHGSHYHPINFGNKLNDLFNLDKPFAFVGLPCHVAGLEMLKAKRPDIKQNHVLSVGLFCGGINKHEGIAFYLKSFGIKWQNVKNLEYRFGKWPGNIRVEMKEDEPEKIVPRIRGNTRWKILRYVMAFQGYWMLKRCRNCPDQVNDFADIAVGDPHLKRLRDRRETGFSIALARTDLGQEIINKLVEKDSLSEEPITIEEAIDSQGFTIENRRHLEAYRWASVKFNMDFPNIVIYPSLRIFNFQHKVFALVDLGKIRLQKFVILRILYYPWQVFEYLFLTFAPRLIIRRLLNLLRNN